MTRSKYPDIFSEEQKKIILSEIDSILMRPEAGISQELESILTRWGKQTTLNEVEFKAFYAETGCLLLEAFMERFGQHFAKVPDQEESDQTDLLKLLTCYSQVPIDKKSSLYHVFFPLFCQMSPELPAPKECFELAQTLIILTEIKDFKNVEIILHDLERWSSPEYPSIYILFGMTDAILKFHFKLLPVVSFRLWLDLIIFIHKRKDPQSMVYTLLYWFLCLKKGIEPSRQKEILCNILKLCSGRSNINEILCLFHIFSLPDHVMAHQMKMTLFYELSKLPSNLLTYYQLHSLYFFAGNYASGIKSRFQDAILYFKYSNYFLYKVWETHRYSTRLLRENLTEIQFYRAVEFWENRIHYFNNQISIQNNTYLENLQSEYQKIEELFKQVEDLSITDELTSIRNRRYLEHNLMQMLSLAARHSLPVSFIMIDIDHFKDVNDNYGHSCGDFVLKELAAILLRDFRKSDILVRYGGEEFLYILFDSDKIKAIAIMEDLRKDVERQAFEFDNSLIKITISIGIRSCVSKIFLPCEITQLISDADAALYHAKNTGRNKVCVFHEPSESENLEIELDK